MKVQIIECCIDCKHFDDNYSYCNDLKINIEDPCGIHENCDLKDYEEREIYESKRVN